MIPALQKLRRAWRGPLAAPPVPLLNPDKRLMVVWSAKAACSTTFVWFANTVGLLGDLEASGKYLHRYREQNYLASDLHRRGLALPLADYRILHVLRDPGSRAVSSYRQALRTGYADKRFPVSGVGPLDRHQGFSFSRFLDYLDTADLEIANIHHRLQRHPVERHRRPDRVINVSRQDLHAELNAIASDFALPHTDFDAITWLRAHEEKRRAWTDHALAGRASDLPLDAEAALGRKPWPDTEHFLDPSTRKRIEALYARDYTFFKDAL